MSIDKEYLAAEKRVAARKAKAAKRKAQAGVSATSSSGGVGKAARALGSRKQRIDDILRSGHETTKDDLKPVR